MGSNRRKIILLDNPLPIHQKTTGLLSRGKINTIAKEDSTKKSEFEWQIHWMNILNSSREEMNTLLTAERSESLKKTQEIEKLNQKLKLQKCVTNEMKIVHENHLKSIQNDKRNKQTQSKQTDVKFVGRSTQTDMCTKKTQSTQTVVKFVDSFSQTDNKTAEKSIQIGKTAYNQATQTDENDVCLRAEASTHQITRKMLLASIVHDHFGMVAKSPPNVISMMAMSKKYKCANCQYSTNKKSSFDDHCAESCVTEAERNMKCPICDQMHTYRTLRLHLNHYASAKCQPQGKHAEYSPSYHKTKLNEHKLLKKRKLPTKRNA